MLPKAFTTIPAPPADVAGEADSEDVTLRPASLFDTAERDALHLRYRKIKVLNYSREVELGRDEVVVKLQSPGKRRSLMMVELKF